jgi:hypothetical protein
MTNQRKLRFIKITCWVGILADALWAVALFSPGLYGLLIGKPDFNPDASFRANMVIGALLMTAWTLLLLWTWQKPVERKAVLLLTAYPITSGLFLLSSANVYLGVTMFGDAVWIMAKTLTLTIIFTTSFIFGRQLEQID